MSTERRLHAEELPASGGELRLRGEAAHHAAVLRLRVGDAITLFDGAGLRADARILAIAKDELLVRAEPARRGDAAGCPVTLVQCLPRGGKLDDLVRAATELGVQAIHLATSDHSVVRAGEERWDRRRERLERVVREAARQCERDSLPVLVAPEPLTVHAGRAPDGAVRLVFCGRSGAPLGPLAPDRPVIAVIGPEGGLSEPELAALDGLGYARVSLGATVLRLETAAVAALAAIAQARRDGSACSRTEASEA